MSLLDPIDLERMAEVTQGNKALIRRLGILLQQSLDECMPGVLTGDAETRRKAAHRLKGGCATIGAARLHALFQAIEDRPQTLDVKTMTRVHQACQETLKRLSEIGDSTEVPGT